MGSLNCTLTTSMENLADFTEPQVTYSKRNDPKISPFHNFIDGKMVFSLIFNKLMEN